MKLTDVMRVWDLIHGKDTGDLGFSDLEQAIDQVIGIRNNVPNAPSNVVAHKGIYFEAGANLGLATCADLLEELSSRIEVHGPGLEYRTIDGEKEEEGRTEAEAQIDKLAKWILENMPDEPGSTGTSEGAVDCAIRILGLAKLLRDHALRVYGGDFLRAFREAADADVRGSG